MKDKAVKGEVRITLRIPSSMLQEMDAVMAARGISNSSDFARQAIRRMIDESHHERALEEARREREIREARAEYVTKGA